MGLDIAFSTKAALDAGAEISLYRPDYMDEMNADIIATGGKPANFEYLMKIEHQWSGRDDDSHFVQVSVNNDNICVRANKWGNTYTPLTAWLKQNDIEWSEF